MIEATVRKDDEPRRWNNNIGPAGKPGNILLDMPSCADDLAHHCVHPALWSCASTPDARHNLAAFLLGEDVGHRRLEQGLANMARKNLAEKWRYGVAHLRVLRDPAAEEAEVIRERL